MSEIIKNLRKIKNLFLIVEIVGTFQLLSMILFRDSSDIKKTVDEIRTINDIMKVELTITANCFYPFKPEYAQINPLNQLKANVKG